MDASPDAQPVVGAEPETAAESGPQPAARLRPVAKIAILDVAAPLAAYYLLRAAGLSTVTALILSGIFPAVGVIVGAIQHRHLDVVGALVLAGIVVGAALGLISHNARLVLMEGSVPTAIFGLGCLGSLWTQRPLMYGMALEFTGRDSAKGREMIRMWQHEGFRHVFRVITAVWGAGFLLEAALRVVVVLNTSANTALTLSKITPYVWIAVFIAWTVAYGRYRRRKGEQMMAAADMGRLAARGKPELGAGRARRHPSSFLPRAGMT